MGYRGLLPDNYLDGLCVEDRAKRYTFGDRDRPTTIVALERGAIAGFATITPARDADVSGCGELSALYVDPDWWGRGIGRALIADARARLVYLGFSDAVLWVMVGNARAERFYRADGWEPDGSRRTESVWGARVDEIRYRRSLMPR